METCKHCGAKLKDGVTTCPQCGKTVTVLVETDIEFPDIKEANENKAMAILSYIWILCLIPLLSKAYKKSLFVKFHLNQGIVVCIFAVGFAIIMTFVFKILVYKFSLAYLDLFIWVLWLIPVIYSLAGIINASSAKSHKLPLIGKIVILK